MLHFVTAWTKVEPPLVFHDNIFQANHPFCIGYVQEQGGAIIDQTICFWGEGNLKSIPPT